MPKRATPTALRKLHGNPHRRPMPVDEPEGVGTLWAPPPWFDDEQRAQWHYAVDNAPLGLLTETDREVMIVWAVASVEHARAVVQVRALGQVVKNAEGTAITNPFMRIMNAQALLMLKAGGEMGFSPLSRVALGRGGRSPELVPHVPNSSDGRATAPPTLARYLDRKPDKLN